MPLLSRWFVRCGFGALVLALLMEILLARPAGLWPGLPDAALHLGAIHLLTVGWLLQLITGVAFWMFPRHPTEPPRGDARLGWWGLGLLNSGLLLRLLGEPSRACADGPCWALGLAGLLQLAAVGCLIRLLWPRVRGVGR
jgi:hypothetical protein